MNIVFTSKKLAKLCNSMLELKKAYGLPKARKIGQRLLELAAAATLADLSHLPPQRCHKLEGNRAGQFAVDTIHPYRIVFEPAHDPVPISPDGSIDRSQVTAICILEVNLDYHD